jgi:outer membrane protein assembly factor BamA
MAAMAFFTGCNITRNVPDGEYLLQSNKVTINKKASGVHDPEIGTDDLYSLIQQQSNDKILGIAKIGLWVNSFTSKGKQTRIKKWLSKSVGQEPVILEEIQVQRSLDMMNLFLNSNGYFNSELTTQISHHKKKATVEYQVKLARPYRINDIEYSISDSSIRHIILQDSANSLLKTGNIYKASDLDDERYRISSLLRNEGYYYFAPEYVYYEIDSAFRNNSFKIYTNIQQDNAPGDSAFIDSPPGALQKYYLNEVSVNPDFNPIRTDTSNMQVITDTTGVTGPGKFNIFYRNKLKIRPQVLERSVFMKPSTLYSEKIENKTYRQLSGFPLFSFTSFNFSAAPDVTDPENPDRKYINCFIELTRRPVQSFSVETEGTTSGSKLGLAGNLVYRNLNIFSGAEVLRIKLTGGVEWQAGNSSDERVLLFFNTVQTGAEATLDFPKFLFPFAQNRTSRTLRPRTTIQTGVNYQNRPDYERYITNASFGYNWLSNSFVSHSLTPIEVNSVSIFPDSAFLIRLEELNDQRLLNQYTDHFIMSAKYSYTFNNQERNKVQNFMYFRWNIETAGNVLGLARNLANEPKSENGEYTVWNIPFAQYARTNIDFRYYFALRDEHTLVYRNLVGVGIPYGNSSVLPFEKGFYAGGSNDMRGWNYRSLGPGSFADSLDNNFEKMGDVILEANFEYRFPVYKWFKGALFTDIGNVWLLNSSENYPGGKFNFDDIINEFAIDAGVGFRLDLTFFIFRIDAAIPLRDPANSPGNRWQFDNLKLKNVVWNFGIGYPF